MINWREIERIEIRTENIFNTAVIIFDSQGRSSIPLKINWIDYLKNAVNPLLVLVTGVEFNSAFCMRNEQWICYENFSVFGQIENLWMDEIS